MKNKIYTRDGSVVDFYEIFNIGYSAGRDEIRSAFCGIIKLFHPDMSGGKSSADSAKIDLIVTGYRILTDDISRREYDSRLFRTKNLSAEGLPVIPGRRIKYSSSLKNIIDARLSMKKMKRADKIYNLGQDIEIFITQSESIRGAVAYIALPARIYCPSCGGQDRECYVCGGVGRISTTSHLEVKINPPAADASIIDVDLMGNRPDKFTFYTMKSLRIRITIINRKEK
jgi:DnaJ-class molecular chaperone